MTAYMCIIYNHSVSVQITYVMLLKLGMIAYMCIIYNHSVSDYLCNVIETWYEAFV